MVDNQDKIPHHLVGKDVVTRVAIFESAAMLVGPLVLEHGLESVPGPANMFMKEGSVTTKVDQHLDHILRVADWLTGKDS